MNRNYLILLKKVTPNFLCNYYKKIYYKYNHLIENRYFKKGEFEKGLKKWYKFKIGETLNLDNPIKLTEKQQWLKIHGVTPKIVMCTDKFLVRKYVSDKIGSKYLIPIINIDGIESFYDANDIDFNKLPNSFVIQCNHGSGMTIVIKDKKSLNEKNIKKIKKKFNKWLKINYSFGNGYEMVYRNIKPCIFITKFLENEGDLPDYKYMCFNGEPKYVWVDKNRFKDHRRTLFNLDWTKADFNINTYKNIPDFNPPINSNEMLKLVKILSKDFIFVRVDLYNIKGKIYFGELTFSSESGASVPSPEKYNEILGDLLKLPIDK